MFLNTRIYSMLEGAIDLHVHPHPDCASRLLNDLEVVSQAKAVNMRAVVFKCHVSSTADRAYIAREAVGGGIEVFGIICLNTAVGGLNPDAVKMAIKMGAKGIWMPSMWADNHCKYVHSSGRRMGYETINVDFPEEGITLTDSSGKLKAEVVEILDLIAEADIMLSTGHVTVEEAHLLLDQAKRAGIKKTIVHTVNYHVLRYPLNDLKEMADKGAMLEFGYSSLPDPIWDPVDPARRVLIDQVCEYIRTVGTKRCVLTSDSGQLTTPIPIECMRLWYEMLKTRGFTLDDYRRMTQANPAKLLGLL
jgi:hypothetical protein